MPIMYHSRLPNFSLREKEEEEGREKHTTIKPLDTTLLLVLPCICLSLHIILSRPLHRKEKDCAEASNMMTRPATLCLMVAVTCSMPLPLHALLHILKPHSSLMEVWHDTVLTCLPAAFVWSLGMPNVLFPYCAWLRPTFSLIYIHHPNLYSVACMVVCLVLPFPANVWNKPSIKQKQMGYYVGHLNMLWISRFALFGGDGDGDSSCYRFFAPYREDITFHQEAETTINVFYLIEL